MKQKEKYMYLGLELLVRFEGCLTPVDALSIEVRWQGLLPFFEGEAKLFQGLQVFSQLS